MTEHISTENSNSTDIFAILVQREKQIAALQSKLKRAESALEKARENTYDWDCNCIKPGQSQIIKELTCLKCTIDEALSQIRNQDTTNLNQGEK
jgi:hypothetical protein